MGNAIRDTLVEVGLGGKLLPSLIESESWEASDDAKTWTFVLRKGVEFHNGKTLDANDVIASINHHRADDSKSSMKPVADETADLKKDGNDIARFDGITVEDTAGPLHYTFPMNTKAAPFDDVNVRRALKHLIDREEVLQKILRDHGSIGNDHPVGPSYRYHASELEQSPYDPEKARFYLQKAGVSELAVDLSTADAAFAGAS